MADQSSYRITARLGGIDVPVTHFELTERLSEPFEAKLDFYDTGFTFNPITFKKLLDGEAVVTLWDDERPMRYINGIVHKLDAGAVGTRRKYFTATLVPELSALKLTTDCRIFQNQTVDAIVRTLLKEHDILFHNFNLKKPRVNRAFCVQYNESVFDFIHRLLAEEGIFYSFEHTKSYHKLLFRDGVELTAETAPLKYQTLSANKTEPCIWDVHYAEQRVTTQTTQRDRTFHNPNYHLEHTYHGLYIENQHKGRYKTYRYNGRYKKDEQGKPFTQYYQQQAQNQQRVAAFTHDYLHIQEGLRFKLKDHPEKDRNQTWVSVQNQLVIEQPQASHEEAQMAFNSGGDIETKFASHFELQTQAPLPAAILSARLAQTRHRRPTDRRRRRPARRRTVLWRLRTCRGAIPLGPLRQGRPHLQLLDPRRPELGRRNLGPHGHPAHRPRSHRRFC